jgi:dCTP deaminase
MAILTGKEIRKQIDQGSIKITPLDLSNIGPNSIDLRVGPKLLTYVNETLSTREEPSYIEHTICPENGFVLMPNTLYIGSTVERIHTEEFVPFFDGRSSFGRLGGSIHQTAGVGEAGFDGTVTLEITVVSKLRIFPQDRICQIYFHTTHGEKSLYKGRYQGQTGPTPSRCHIKGSDLKGFR